MKQNMIKNTLNCIIFSIRARLFMIKNKIAPEKDVPMSKDDALELYSRFIDGLNRKDQIFMQIDDLSKKVSDNKETVFPELRDFDFDLYKLRFLGSYFVLESFMEYLRKKIFSSGDEKIIYTYNSYHKVIREIEKDMNYKIELMCLIRDYIEVPKSCVSRKSRKDFRRRTRRVFE